MPRPKRKRLIVESDSGDETDLVTRRSSLNVNLSFVSNFSDSDHGSLRKTATESDENSEDKNENLLRTSNKRKKITADDIATPASATNVTVISAADRKVSKKPTSKSPGRSMSAMREKDQQLSKNAMELKNAIINKTQSLLDKELAKRTSAILTGCSSEENLEVRSPRVHVNIGKDDQIVMAECGENQNPVRVTSMSQKSSDTNDENDKASQNSDHNSTDYSQSIASTPKKPNIKTSVDKSTGRTSKEIIKIPVARLFSDNDPNDSMSEINSVPIPENIRSNVPKEPESNRNNNIVRMSSTLANKMSPILSQGTRKNRTRLSLKRISTIDEARDSRTFTNTTNESFINRPPLTCSSYIERPQKTSSTNNSNQLTKTIVLEEKSDSSDNQKTINLDGNDNNTKTINIDQSSSRSSMEITAISARSPIVRKSFQKVIRKSINFDIANIPGLEASKRTNANDSSTKKASELDSANAENKGTCQDSCSPNAVKTSLDVNTSLDDVSLAERVIQKENRKPSNIKPSKDQSSKNNPAKQSKKLSIMQSSLCVNTSLDSIRKSSDSSKIDSDQERRESIQLQPASSNSNQEKEASNSIRKSSDSSKIDSDQERRESIQLQPASSNSNQKKEASKGTRSHQPSNGTVRTSMQMNTSLDSVQKSPTQEPLNYNKILSMVEEASCTDNSQTLNLQCQSPDADTEVENVSLRERIQRKAIAKNKKQDTLKEKALETSRGKDNPSSERESDEPGASSTNTKRSRISEKNELEGKRKSKKTNVDNSSSENSEPSVRRSTRKSKANSTRKNAANNENVTSNTDESSIVEPTPFPASRSLLFKTMIKNNMAMNTLNPRNLAESSEDDENDGPHLPLSKKTNSSPNKHRDVEEDHNADSDDTVIVNSSDESSNESNKKREKVVIDESMNDTNNQSKSKTSKKRKSRKKRESEATESSDDEEINRKIANKRKLFPLRENSQISFSPAEMTQAPLEAAPKEVKRKKKLKKTQKKQEDVRPVSPEPDETSDHTENEVVTQPEKKKKKPRKIKSKKIVIKKLANLTMLDNLLANDDGMSTRNNRSSLREFDLRKNRDETQKNNNSINHKIVIVVTGLDKDDKDLVKNVIKGLGSATLQSHVTPRTTHVISSGVRTINLLKGIIRGCWLITIEWALKSLESGKWLDPLPYEMSHFAKAVRVNRRDRKIFGKAYVPELFFTCGPIYIASGTVPPASHLKDLVKTAGGSITEDENKAKIIIGSEGLRENWILDSITTGEIQSFNQYKRN